MIGQPSVNLGCSVIRLPFSSIPQLLTPFLHARKIGDIGPPIMPKKDDSPGKTPPVAVQRERALSVSSQLDRGANTNQQLQSRLCALPAELRLQIYQELIGKRSRIHIAFLSGCLVGYRCQRVDDSTNPADHVQCWKLRFKEHAPPPWTAETDSSMLGICGLLQSCRIM
jgi:hypothetical protein